MSSLEYQEDPGKCHWICLSILIIEVIGVYFWIIRLVLGVGDVIINCDYDDDDDGDGDGDGDAGDDCGYDS